MLKYLLWMDLETTSLPDGNDYSGVHILEVGAILTTLDLNRLEGYTEVAKLTPEAADSLRANDYVKAMHKKSGLTQESIDSEMTVTDIEDALLDLLEEFGVGKGEVALAGSGVAAFDFNVIKEHMPRLAAMFPYYSYDIGSFRRMFKVVAPRDVVNPTAHKHGDEKIHRAMADVEDHLSEAEDYQAALGDLIPPF